nr:hypothetical protein GCM10020063_083220 [Dactylosporangium thailandense]
MRRATSVTAAPARAAVTKAGCSGLVGATVSGRPRSPCRAAGQLGQQRRLVLRRRLVRRRRPAAEVGPAARPAPQLLGRSERIGAPTTPVFVGAGGASANPDFVRVWRMVCRAAAGRMRRPEVTRGKARRKFLIHERGKGWARGFTWLQGAPFRLAKSTIQD